MSDCPKCFKPLTTGHLCDDIEAHTFVSDDERITALERKLAVANENAEHWEATCHAQWETSRTISADNNKLAKENVTLKAENERLRDALQKAEPEPLVLEAVDCKGVLKGGITDIHEDVILRIDGKCYQLPGESDE